MTHAVLLGDSIFDNGAYVPGEPDVIAQLRTQLPSRWTASLLAVDGDTTADIPRQLTNLPDDATHLFISIGGNDAIGNLDRLKAPASSVLGALDYLAVLRHDFQRAYRHALTQALSTGRHVTVCTIYDAVPGLTRGLHAALCLYNDVILREAALAGVPVIDLRHICTEPGDYSAISPIEPSYAGGMKIAARIAAELSELN